MSLYCLKCKKNQESVNTKVYNDNGNKTNNGKTMLLSKCSICGSKKLRLIKKQEASGILNSLGLKTSLSKISLFGGILL